MNKTLLSVKGLYKTFKSGREDLDVLKNLSLEVDRGSSTAILGQSGSGKSTLLNIIGGLDRPSRGTVRVGETAVEKLSEVQLKDFRSRSVGFVFQFHYLLKDFTALENVMLPAHIAGLSKKKAIARARELISELALNDRENHFPSQLSGGERQRLAIARALINSPELILADEPTGNLDPANSKVVSDLLFNLCESHGKTLILVTHDKEIARRAERRLNLVEGAFEVLDGEDE